MSCYITQCLHCQTRFRITAEQLAVAQGKVRCGACQQVFDAYQQLQPYPAPVLSEPMTATEAAPHAEAANEPSPPCTSFVEPESSKHDSLDESELTLPFDIDLDKIDLDAELALIQQQEQEWLQRQHQPLPNTQSTSITDSEPLPLAPEDTPFEFSDELLALPKKATPTRKDTSSQDSLDSHGAETEPVTSLSALLDEPPATEPTINTANPTTALYGDRNLRAEAAPALNIIDDPLQLDWQKPRHPWKRSIFWMMLNLIALAALLGQYIYFNANDLMHQERYRTLFETLCPVLQCEVPPRVDISRIQSSNLVVRSHPSYAGALAVDAIIYNRAEFAQPFPLLELKFSDINGKPVSSRNFRPSEYLSGELAGSTSMPPQTPIHISLEILDPGENAVNYTLGFNSP